MTDWKCPNCGYTIGQVTTVAPAGFAAGTVQTFTVMDSLYGRCMTCGERLPPPSAASHQCAPIKP